MSGLFPYSRDNPLKGLLRLSRYTGDYRGYPLARLLGPPSRETIPLWDYRGYPVTHDTTEAIFLFKRPPGLSPNQATEAIHLFARLLRPIYSRGYRDYCLTCEITVAIISFKRLPRLSSYSLDYQGYPGVLETTGAIALRNYLGYPFTLETTMVIPLHRRLPWLST